MFQAAALAWRFRTPALLAVIVALFLAWRAEEAFDSRRIDAARDRADRAEANAATLSEAVAARDAQIQRYAREAEALRHERVRSRDLAAELETIRSRQPVEVIRYVETPADGRCPSPNLGRVRDIRAARNAAVATRWADLPGEPGSDGAAAAAPGLPASD